MLDPHDLAGEESVRRLYNFYKKLPRKRNLCEPCAHSPKRKKRQTEGEGAKKENLFFIDRREIFSLFFHAHVPFSVLRLLALCFLVAHIHFASYTIHPPSSTTTTKVSEKK